MWLAYVSIFSKIVRASLSRPARVSASTYQNEQRLNVRSSPASPSWPVIAYRCTGLSDASCSPIRSRVRRKRGSRRPGKLHQRHHHVAFARCGFAAPLQPLHERRGLFQKTERHQRVDGECRVAKPAVPVVPVTVATGGRARTPPPPPAGSRTAEVPRSAPRRPWIAPRRVPVRCLHHATPGETSPRANRRRFRQRSRSERRAK